MVFYFFLKAVIKELMCAVFIYSLNNHVLIVPGTLLACWGIKIKQIGLPWTVYSHTYSAKYKGDEDIN